MDVQGDRKAAKLKVGHTVQRGVTSIEYALLAALIALALIGALSSTGLANGGIWATWTAAVMAIISP